MLGSKPPSASGEGHQRTGAIPKTSQPTPSVVDSCSKLKQLSIKDMVRQKSATKLRRYLFICTTNIELIFHYTLFEITKFSEMISKLSLFSKKINKISNFERKCKFQKYFATGSPRQRWISADSAPKSVLYCSLAIPIQPPFQLFQPLFTIGPGWLRHRDNRRGGFSAQDALTPAPTPRLSQDAFLLQICPTHRTSGCLRYGFEAQPTQVSFKVRSSWCKLYTKSKLI